MHKHNIITAGVVLAALTGCSDAADGNDGLPQEAPTQVELLADDGFQDAGAVAASPDGTKFYVAAYDDGEQPGLFEVGADGSTQPLHVGAPLSYPTDVAVSCDGNKIFVSDLGGASLVDPIEDLGEEDVVSEGGIYVFGPDGGEPTAFAAEALGRAAGLIVSVDCETLYISGFTPEGVPAVFTAATDGGAVSVLHQGAPLVSPTGIHVDADNVAWVMDHFAKAESGAPGVLFAIDADAKVTEVVGGLGMGRHGGVSLAPGGVTAVIPVSDDLGG